MTTEISKKSRRKSTTALRRRKQIYEAGLHLFLKKGFKGTTMREISEEVNITAPGLYNFVRSKHDIFVMFAENLKVDTEMIDNYRKSLGDVSPTQALRECCKYWLTQSKIEQDFTIILERDTYNFDPDIQQALLEDFKKFIHLFEELLHNGIKAGEFQVGNVTLVAFNIVMARIDFAMKRWYLRKLFTPEEYVSDQIENILKQVMPDKSRKIDTEVKTV